MKRKFIQQKLSFPPPKRILLENVETKFNTFPVELIGCVARFLRYSVTVHTLSLVSHAFYDSIFGEGSNVLWKQICANQALSVTVVSYRTSHLIAQKITSTQWSHWLINLNNAPSDLIDRLLRTIEPFVESLLIFLFRVNCQWPCLSFPRLKKIHAFGLAVTKSEKFCDGRTDHFETLVIDGASHAACRNLREISIKAADYDLIHHNMTTLKSISIGDLNDTDIIHYVQAHCPTLNTLQLFFTQEAKTSKELNSMPTLKSLYLRGSFRIISEILSVQFDSLLNLTTQVVDPPPDNTDIFSTIKPLNKLAELSIYDYSIVLPLVNTKLKQLKSNRPLSKEQLQRFTHLVSYHAPPMDNLEDIYSICERNRVTLKSISLTLSFSTLHNLDLTKVNAATNLRLLKLYRGIKLSSGKHGLLKLAQYLGYLQEIEYESSSRSLKMHINSEVQWEQVTLDADVIELGTKFFDNAPHLTRLRLTSSKQSTFSLVSKVLKNAKTRKLTKLQLSLHPTFDLSEYTLLPKKIKSLTLESGDAFSRCTLNEIMIAVVCAHFVKRVQFWLSSKELTTKLMKGVYIGDVTRKFIDRAKPYLMGIVQNEKLDITDEQRATIINDYEKLFVEDNFEVNVAAFPAVEAIYMEIKYALESNQGVDN